jgi:hypothetical protein
MKVRLLTKVLLILFTTISSCFPSQKNMMNKQENSSGTLLADLMRQYPAHFDSILRHKDEMGVQIIYTQIDRDHKQRSSFTHHHFNTNNNRYFYPASTVKFPVAVLALQKLNELRIDGLDMNTTMITGADGETQTEVCHDPTAADGRPTIAHYIKKILLVSDNDAFNRLYEFLGQEYIHHALHEMGYRDVQLIHRLSINLTEQQNRHTNPVRFIDTSGHIIYEKPAEKSQLVYTTKDIRLGKGYIRGEELVNEPFDFSLKNRLPLQSLHEMVLSVMFPESMPRSQRFNLSDEDLQFLRRYMSMRPAESVSPVYPQPDYWDNYVKMLYYGSEKTTPDTNIRIFNKTGTAYGFLIDAAYVADYKNNVEFMLSAVIYCNSDGIFNDDKYDYTNVGYPFLKQLGYIIHDHELKRKRKYAPDLSSFRFEYR